MIKLNGLFSIGFADVIGNCATAVFWFYIATLLDPHKYGELSYFIGIAGVASAVSMIGAQNVITVYTAKRFNVLSSLYTITMIVGTIAAIVLSILFNRIDISLLFLGYLISGLSLGHILGKKLYSDYSKYVIIQKVLTLALGIGFYYIFGPNSVIYALSISYIFFIFVLYKILKGTKFGFADLRPHFGFIINNYVVSLAGRLTGQIDKLIIAPILGFVILGNYNLATQVATISLMLSQIVFKYTLPHDSSGNQNKKLKKIMILISISISALGIVLSPIVIPTLFPKYTDVVQTIQIMILDVIPATLILQYTSRFLGLEKSRFILIGTIIGLITMIVSIIVLGSFFGMVGLAIAYVLSDLTAVIYYYIMNRTLKEI